MILSPYKTPNHTTSIILTYAILLFLFVWDMDYGFKKYINEKNVHDYFKEDINPTVWELSIPEFET